MKPIRSSAGKSSVVARAAKLAAAIAEKLSRSIESLGPQPELRPVPVRVRKGSRGH